MRPPTRCFADAFSIRDAFISDAAHQIRNPIAAIQSQAEAAQTAHSEPELRQRIADVAASARAAGRLTNQLLSMERIRGRSLRSHFQPCDLVEIVARRVRSFAEVQLRRDVDVAFKVTGATQPVTCDPIMVEELLVNLLDNAAAYGLKPGGKLDVSLDYSEENVVLTLQDDGRRHRPWREGELPCCPGRCLLHAPLAYSGRDRFQKQLNAPFSKTSGSGRNTGVLSVICPCVQVSSLRGGCHLQESDVANRRAAEAAGREDRY